MIRDRFDRLLSRWANLHPLVRFLAVIGVLAGAAFLTAKPAYRAFKDWRLERNLAAAGVAVSEQRMQAARDLSLAVLRSGRPDIEAFRILEQSTASLGDPRHLDIARALITHPEGTDEDRLTGFLAVVMDMPLGQVGQTWVALGESLHPLPEFASAFAARLLAEERLSEAAGVLLTVPEEARDPAVRQGLARVLMATGREEGFDEAQRLIAEGVTVDPGDVGGWLDVLEEIPVDRIRPDQLAPVGDALDDLAGEQPARAALVRARLTMAGPEADRKAIVDELVRSWRDTDGPGLARFLRDHGLDERLLEAFGAEESVDDPGLVRLVMQATMRLGQWDAAAQWMEAHGAVLPGYEEAALRAILADHSGDNAGRSIAWRSALDAAGQQGSSQALLALHRLAEEAGMSAQAESAMLAAIRSGRGPLPLYDAQRPLIQSLAAAGRENTLLEICAIYLALEPVNPVLLTQYAYLACVHEVVEPERLLPPLRALAAALPNELPVHTTLATALLADGRAEEAADVLQPFGLGNPEISPSFRVVHLVSEVMNGRLAKDDPQVVSFPWNQLQPTERRKFTAMIHRTE